MNPCTAFKNTYIFSQGDPSGSYYIILSGSCRVEINSKYIKVLSCGDAFGDYGIVYNAPRSASIKALTDCNLVQLGKDGFNRAIEEIHTIHES